MADQEKHFGDALDVVNRYYQRIVESMAHEIVEREESILEGGYGWTEIEDRYANRFFNVSQIYGNLIKFAQTEADDELAAFAPPVGVEASRLQIEERRCSIESTRDTIEQWLKEHDDVHLWKLVVHPVGDDQATCLFLYTS